MNPRKPEPGETYFDGHEKRRVVEVITHDAVEFTCWEVLWSEPGSIALNRSGQVMWLEFASRAKKIEE